MGGEGSVQRGHRDHPTAHKRLLPRRAGTMLRTAPTEGLVGGLAREDGGEAPM